MTIEAMQAEYSRLEIERDALRRTWQTSRDKTRLTYIEARLLQLEREIVTMHENI